MPKAPNRLQNVANLRIANADGAFSTAFATLVTGSFLVGFLKLIGAGDIWVNLLSAIPSLLGLLQIPGAIFGRRSPGYKRYVQSGSFVWRALYIPVAFLPMVAFAAGLKLLVLVTCISIAAACVLWVNPTYNDWMAELVPASSRGYFFSRRNALTAVVGSFVGFIGGVIVDHFRNSGNPELGFSTVFGLGVVCAMISFTFLSMMHDTQRPVVVKENFRQAVVAMSEPVKDPNFRRVLIFMGVFIFGQQFVGNLYTAYALESLKLPFSILQLTAVFQALGMVLTAPFLGFLTDKYGNKPILTIVGFGLTLTPVMWLFCYPNQTPHNAAILLPIYIILGVIWAGVNLAQFNLILATAKPERRSSYLGVALALQSLVGFVAPILGAYTLTFFRSITPDANLAYKMLFVVNMALRFAAIFFILPVAEQGALRLRKTLTDLARVTPRGVRAMRQLARSSDVSSREAAIEGVASNRVSMAADELVRALHDPSPRIRRQAALALAELNDPEAASALVHQLVDHPDLIEEEIVEAVGVLGGPECVEPLSRLLRDPRSVVRRAAAKALGRIGDDSAVSALIEAAGQHEDSVVRRASLQALRSLSAQGAEALFEEAVTDPQPSIRIAAAEGIAELNFVRAAPSLRRSIEQFTDEATSEVAYALGCIGTDRDIPLILKVAAQCKSMITRRRCLLGVARLLQIEREVYRIMLMEGLGRDTALLSQIGSLMKRSKRIRAAVAAYSSADEAGALNSLAHTAKDPILTILAATPVEESFLLAIFYVLSRRAPFRN